MPTPTGKPKVGERIKVRRNLNSSEPEDWVYGTVTRREDGLIWSIHWRPDGFKRDLILSEAGWMMSRGYLKIAKGGK